MFAGAGSTSSGAHRPTSPSTSMTGTAGYHSNPVSGHSDHDLEPIRKHSLASDNNTPSKRAISSTNGDSSIAPTIHRANRACKRCRQQKLRCLGGMPCERCVKAGQTCNFDPSSGGRHPHRKGPAGESGVEQDRERKLRRSSKEVHFDENPGREDLSSSMSTGPSLPKHIGQATRISPADTSIARFSSVIDQPPIGYQPQDPLSPGLSAPRQEPTPTRSSIASLGDNQEEQGGGPPLEAEDSLYEAPFRSILVESRRNSFDASSIEPSPPRSNYDSSMFRADDDPINTGILEETNARLLFDFFVEHCHPFLPILNLSLDDPFAATRQFASLFSAIAAVASRFYREYNKRHSSSAARLELTTPRRLANLAEAHLGHTLLRRPLGHADVQASLLLAAWNLQHEGTTGPDAWLVTGHAARICRRLGVHRVLAHAAETARTTERGSEEWHQLQRSVSSWRTWLCWFTFDGFLSLGHGRPQSTQFETVDDSGFLRMRLEQSPLWPRSGAVQSLHGDVYIASQVQLTQIVRDLINWSEMLADPGKAVQVDRRRATMFTGDMLSFGNMSKNLNDRLDEWARLWVWPSSTYGSYLGPGARVARLQLEHLRLCLNGPALSYQIDGSDEVARCLRFASNAAIGTIQLHHESTQTDLGLSFATDYLITALAHAAVFLIRLSMSSEVVLTASRMQTAILDHHVETAIEVLDAFDLSETGIARYLAKRVRVARRKLTALAETQRQTASEIPNTTLNDLASIDCLAVQDRGQGGDQFDFSAFFQDSNDYDVDRLLDQFNRQGAEERFGMVDVDQGNNLLYPPTDGSMFDFAALATPNSLFSSFGRPDPPR